MICVLSDIHGDVKAFDEILEKTGFSENDELYILGDVIDRGKDGIALLRRISEDPRVKMITGNHEYMMLNALSAGIQSYEYSLWMRNGGLPTMQAFSSLEEHERRKLLRYLLSLPLEIDLTIQGRAYRLVHAAPSECMPEGCGNKTEFCVWTRIDPRDEWLDGRIVLFGHTPTAYYGSELPMRIMRFENNIALDCGMASGRPHGRLGCLRLDDMAEFYSS